MQIEFEEKINNCPLCCSKNIVEEYNRMDFCQKISWSRCEECTFYFQNPSLTQESLSSIYNSEIYWNAAKTKGNKDSEKGYQDYQSGEAYRTRQSEKRLKVLSKFVSPPAKILDLACATGFFAGVAKAEGFDVEGVELSREMALWGEARYGVKIHCGTFEDADLTVYDLVALWGADSNFKDPRKVFSKINSILKNDGLLAFNYFDFDHFTKFLRPNFKKVYNCMYNLNSKTMPLLLSKSGFEIIYNRMETQYMDLHKLFGVLRYHALLKLINRFGINFEFLFPTIGGYLVIARKVRHIFL